jgi:hypothetical protein
MDDISITVNSEELRPKEFTMTNFVGDSRGFVATVKTDDKIKSLQSLSLQMEDSTIKWDNLDGKKEMHYFFSPFYNQHDYITDIKH